MEKEATHLSIDLFFEVIFHSPVLASSLAASDGGIELWFHLPNLQKVFFKHL